MDTPEAEFAEFERELADETDLQALRREMVRRDDGPVICPVREAVLRRMLTRRDE